MRSLAAAVLAVSIAAAPALGAVPEYAAGQVWQYHTRPEDEGSLLKIQKIESGAAGQGGVTIYQISVAGVRLGKPPVPTLIAQMPVTKETLDASVTELAKTEPPKMFPNIDEPIAKWHEKEGGHYSLPVAAIVDIADRAVLARTKPGVAHP
jgi:hypothetical protein